MTLTDLLLVLILPAAVLVVALCSASETAVFSLSHSDRARMRRGSPEAEQQVRLLLARPRSFLLSVLLLTSAANVVYFVVGATLERRIGNHVVGVAVNIALALVLVLGADILPKLLAREHRITFCRVSAGILVATRDAVHPLTRVLEVLFIEPFVRLARPVGGEQGRALTTEELGALLELSARTGALGADEQRLLGEVVELGNTRVREVMTPRIAMAWLEENSGSARVREVASASGLGQVPVFRGGLEGKLAGMLELRRYLPAAEGDGPTGARGPRLAEFLTPALCIPERARLDQLMAQMTEQHRGRAVCVDEFGAVVGVVGLEDVAGRLLSRGSETRSAEEAGIERLGPGLWEVPGRLPARELAEYFFSDGGRVQTSGSATTVGGLFFARLGRVPRPGDVVELGNVRLEVAAMSARSIDRVRVSVAEEVGA